MEVVSVKPYRAELVGTDKHSIYNRSDSGHWMGLRSDGSWESLYPSRAREMEAAYQAFKKEQET